MKKNLLFAFLIMFVLSATAFAGFTDPKTGSDKSAATTPKENRLSEEEIGRMNRNVEITNMDKTTLSNKENNALKKDLNATEKQDRRYGYVWVGGSGLLLLIILIILLV
jgi:hypothetical protein